MSSLGLREGETLEIVVVSDGSIDTTEAELVAQGQGSSRVFHYDRNLGKGYAVKLGALEAAGDWVGFVDADLDLDPAALQCLLALSPRHLGLDFAIGSKRHPDSEVHYPPVRVIASWLFQQVVRLLFRLDVRDTQVGLKVFNRCVAGTGRCRSCSSSGTRSTSSSSPWHAPSDSVGWRSCRLGWITDSQARGSGHVQFFGRCWIQPRSSIACGSFGITSGVVRLAARTAGRVHANIVRSFRSCCRRARCFASANIRPSRSSM